MAQVSQAASSPALIARAAKGDRDAQEVLLAELLPRVRNLVRYVIRGDRDVDDITQMALIDVLRGLPGYRGDAPFLRWVDRVCVRAALTQVKKARALRQREEVVEDAATYLHAVPPEAHRDRFFARRELVGRLDKLPSEQRQAVVLHHVVGFTVAEVAEQLEMPFDTVKSRIRLGMKKLRENAEGVRYATQGQ